MHVIAAVDPPRNHQQGGDQQRRQLAWDLRGKQPEQYQAGQQWLEVAVRAIDPFDRGLLENQCPRHAPTPAPLQPDNRIGDRQGGQCRRPRDKRERPEIQAAGLADQDVLRVADQAGRGAGVAGQRQGQEKRPRIEAAGQQAVTQQRGQGEGDYVVDQQRRQQAAEQHHAAQQQRRALPMVAELGVEPGIDPGKIELRGNQHQRQQQQQRPGIQMAGRLAWRLEPAEQQHYRRTAGDPAAVDAQARNASRGHAQVGHDEQPQHPP
ncbi:hypothetical protein D3C71_1492570 [compost metagenome]